MGKEIYLKSKEAAAYIGVCYRTMQTYIADGLIPCTKPAGRWLFKQRDLDAFMENINITPKQHKYEAKRNETS